MEQDTVFERLLQIVERYNREQKSGPFIHYHEPDQLSEILRLDQGDGEGDWEAIFDWVEKYLAYAVKTGNPGYINRMWAGANLPSVIGEIITAITNTSACTFETAPVSTLMEQYMFREMLDIVGFENGAAQMTTGSSNANMIVMMAARNTVFPQSKSQGIAGMPKICGFVNADAHYSMDRAAAILGIGTDNLIKVDVDEHGRMRADVLEERILQAREQGAIPFFVAATAGTTVRGAYDQLEPLLALRDEHNFWLHVDGAWGGAVVMSDTLSSRYLPHLEQADSFTLDFHKMLGTALMCNVLLFNRRPDILREICSAGDESYIFRSGKDGQVRDLGTLSLQCGRKVDGLKWFLDWKFFGRDGFGRRIEEYLELCRYAEERISESDELEMVVPRESFNVCFRHKVTGDISVEEFNIKLRNTLQKQQRALVGTGYVNGQLVIRLLITNTSVGKPEIDALLEHVVVTGQEVLAESY